MMTAPPTLTGAQAPLTDTVPGRYWHHLDDGRIQCDVCPRYCKLGEGQRGLCFVRARQNDQVVLTTWGRSSGFCIDPVEKKPLNHFFPGSPVLSFGTAGCNLTCKFCQNHEISKARQMDAVGSLATPDMIVQTAKQWGCSAVAFTYNDPVIFLEYAEDVAKACRAAGIKTIAVTAGYIGKDARTEFFRHMDAANVDLKGFTEAFYHKLCSAHLDDVLETLVYLKQETGVWFELTNLVIPGENDSDDEFDAMTRWIMANLGPDVPLHFSAFHPDWKMMDTPRTPAQTLIRARNIARQNGLRYVYVGNVHDHAASSTYCHQCHTRLIGRDWYELSDWKLDAQGHCTQCGTTCAGVFRPQPGNWGRKRQPVRLSPPQAGS
ncbi:AmmeMemoRadiSam system radical SAM enzyme [Thalassospira sp. NFXS8]|uniref:AmmeMemoRadiSam system radical SAM enzyme n=1 Tax=Thalassospira sp. NFXS8 TaxID=2819093 RepID=UPI0032DF27F1